MNHLMNLRFGLLCGLVSSMSLAAVAQPLPPVNLRVEYVPEPVGVDTPAPRFSWWMNHEERNEGQTAYQLQVATSGKSLETDLPDVWDTGKIASDNNVHIVYAGLPLESARGYHWRVRLWDRQDRPSPYSQTASFEMGLMQPDDFQAKWVRCIEDIVDSKGYQSARMDSADKNQFVQINLNSPREVAAVILHPARSFVSEDDDTGFGFPVRFTVTVSAKQGLSEATVIADRISAAQPEPGAAPVEFTFEPVQAQFIRLNVEELSGDGHGRYILALAEIEVRDAQGNNLAQGASVDTMSFIDENGWSKRRIVDGIMVSQNGCSTSPLMRKTFSVDKQVLRARAYVSGLGYYELYLNGRRAGNHVLDPANQLHEKRALYAVYDVGALLREGENAAGLMLGHGWWRGTCSGWLQLRIEYRDGTVHNVTTDESWRWSRGPILAESLYHGETYDARLELPGWNDTGFDDSAWQAVELLEKPPAVLSSQIMPPIRRVERILPVSLTPRDDGPVIVDFGQNLTGWIRLKAEGPAGTEIKMRHSELLYPDGRVNQENLRSAKVTDRYILKGDGEETYTPRFTQHGFRYAEITGYPGTLTADKLEAEVIHTDLRRAGHFECSNELYNKIRDISIWSLRGNNMSIPTDCPQRDERMGWMGDAHLAAESSILNFDMAAYYENFLRVIADCQSEEGFIPDTAPLVWGKSEGSPPWAIAYPLIAWYCYRYYDDLRAVEQHYDGIVRWTESLDRRASGSLMEYCHYGDWVAVEETPLPPIGTGCYFWVTKILEEFAGVLGKEEDRAKWADKGTAIAAAYNAKYFNVEKNYHDAGSQFSQIWPVYLGIAEGPQREAAMQRLIGEIETTRNGHLATGILGTKYVFDVLVEAGRPDLAYTVSLQEDYPSWGFMIDNDATTLWELWKLETGPGMNSHNHQMFGSVVDWFFGHVAGIDTLPEPGYRHFVVAPLPDERLTHAQAMIKTVRGNASCAWSRSDAGYDYRIVIPCNSTARVVIPKIGRMLEAGTGTPTPVEETSDSVVFDLGSGTYEVRMR